MGLGLRAFASVLGFGSTNLTLALASTLLGLRLTFCSIFCSFCVPTFGSALALCGSSTGCGAEFCVVGTKSSGCCMGLAKSSVSVASAAAGTVAAAGTATVAGAGTVAAAKAATECKHRTLISES